MDRSPEPVSDAFRVYREDTGAGDGRRFSRPGEGLARRFAVLVSRASEKGRGRDPWVGTASIRRRVAGRTGHSSALGRLLSDGSELRDGIRLGGIGDGRLVESRPAVRVLSSRRRRVIAAVVREAATVRGSARIRVLTSLFRPGRRWRPPGVGVGGSPGATSAADCRTAPVDWMDRPPAPRRPA
jgi:hypothetical protein